MDQLAHRSCRRLPHSSTLPDSPNFGKTIGVFENLNVTLIIDGADCNSTRVENCHYLDVGNQA
jgi:hypothetical protein